MVYSCKMINFVLCAFDFEIVENVNERQNDVAQTEVVNDGVIDVGWGCNFQTKKCFLHRI